MTNVEKQELIQRQQEIILNRRAKLGASDYIAAKIAEGKATKTEYKDKIAERQQWRDDINAAEAEIASLEAIVTVEEGEEQQEAGTEAETQEEPVSDEGAAGESE